MIFEMFIKFLNKQLVHHGFEYKEGLNEDSIVFNPSGSCKPGGLYFTTFKHFDAFVNYGELIADVEIPADAKVYPDPEGNKWKANKIIVRDIRPIADMFKDKSDQYIHDALKQHGMLLKYVPIQTLKLCYTAIRQMAHALQYVEQQTPDLCLEAVRQNALSIAYAKEQTEQLCITAVQKNSYALLFIREQTVAICRVAIHYHPKAIRYVDGNIKLLLASKK